MARRFIHIIGQKLAPLIITFTALSLTIFLGLYGCAAPAPKPLAESIDMVWPAGAEIPRVRFLKSISKPEDFPITQSALKRIWNYIVGKDEDSLSPFGVTVDTSGRLYALDMFQRRVQVFDAIAGEFSTFPDDDHPITSPIGIAVAKNGRVFISDSQDKIIKVFRRVGDDSPINIGSGLFLRPTGTAVNQTNNELLVVDTKLSQVFRFDLDTYKFKGTFGTKGPESGQFNNPTNIAVAKNGNILITDTLNFRVQIFSPEGVFLSAFGSAGDSPGHFARPRGIATDSDDNIYVVDAIFDNIQIFDKTGRLLMDFGKSGQQYGEFWMPAGIWVDTTDKIYVADSYNKRVQIFQYLKQKDELR